MGRHELHVCGFLPIYIWRQTSQELLVGSVAIRARGVPEGAGECSGRRGRAWDWWRRWMNGGLETPYGLLLENVAGQKEERGEDED